MYINNEYRNHRKSEKKICSFRILGCQETFHSYRDIILMDKNTILHWYLSWNYLALRSMNDVVVQVILHWWKITTLTYRTLGEHRCSETRVLFLNSIHKGQNICQRDGIFISIWNITWDDSLKILDFIVLYSEDGEVVTSLNTKAIMDKCKLSYMYYVYYVPCSK